MKKLFDISFFNYTSISAFSTPSKIKFNFFFIAVIWKLGLDKHSTTELQT
jgi:hypothetical protein